MTHFATFFKPGQNCWGVAEADRLSVLIDAESYYRAFLSTLRQAKYSILILAWDIHTHTLLEPKDPHSGSRGITLEKELIAALEKNSDLNVSILCWDFAMVYALQRQLFPQFRKAFRHPRIHFVIDSYHPFGASQHQKIVIIDDKLAYVGGLDLCLRRWDTRFHRAYEPRRLDPNAEHYLPFHDVQVVLTGKAANLISDLAKDRWWRATGQRLPNLETSRVIWPQGVEPDFQNVQVGVARTYFSSSGEKRIREIEQLFVDSIASAETYVYIENQYFTSTRIAEAISKRLLESECPEFLILLPRYNLGWIEERAMAVLRTRLIQELLEKDPNHRLRFYFPVVYAQTSSRYAPISLHSKVMIVDDRILHIGSANLSNRSMGLDTECDIALVAEGGDRVSKTISSIRNSLLAEHSGWPVEEVSKRIADTGSLFSVLDQTVPNRSNRALISFPTRINRIVNQWTPVTRVLDPDRPIEEDPFFSQFMPKSKTNFRKLKNLKIKLRLALIVLTSLILMFPQASDDLGIYSGYLSLQNVVKPMNPYLSTFIVILLGSVLRVPMDVPIFAMAALIFSFWSWLNILIGIIGVSLVVYSFGRGFSYLFRNRLKVGRTSLLDGGVLQPKSEFWAHVLLQWNLVAPFVIVCFQAGKIETPVFVFLSGTLLGQLFRILLITGYASLFARLVIDPDILIVMSFLVLSFGLLVVSSWSNQRFLPSYADPKSQ